MRRPGNPNSGENLLNPQFGGSHIIMQGSNVERKKTRTEENRRALNGAGEGWGAREGMLANNRRLQSQRPLVIHPLRLNLPGSSPGETES